MREVSLSEDWKEIDISCLYESSLIITCAGSLLKWNGIDTSRLYESALIITDLLFKPFNAFRNRTGYILHQSL